ncbi:MAG: aminopeptidase P family protein [Defluviitaleaceae bacterium]|nr:aminopeptidase P family protein [Defluviitaleaceae bacterium]
MLDKLESLRKLMRDNNIDAYVVPSGDAHASEYTADYWRTRPWISGFNGSSGTAVITTEKAGVWTDGRYFIQAEKELKGTGFDLYKEGEPNVPSFTEFLADNLPQGGTVGFDGRIVTAENFEKIKTALNKKSVTYFYKEDLIEKIWQDRPALPTAPAFEHAPNFAGKSATEKLATVRAKMKEKNITAYLLPALDDIAWLLNIRGRDTFGLPVVYSYVLITDTEAHVFIDPTKIPDLYAKLTFQGFTMHGYDTLPAFLNELKTTQLYYNPTNTNVLLTEAIPQDIQISNNATQDIVRNLKCIKTEVEIANIRNAFVKEGVVLVKTIKWLEETIATGKPLIEGDVVRTLQKFRAEQAHYISDSFSTISAHGANAAQAHYNSGAEGSSIKPDNFYLLDTGGNYLDGTTDTSRTFALCEPTEEMKRDYTLVLKGVIALSRTIFPNKTLGIALDAIARQSMWENGLDYKHGTGHGIGYCLSVHEGPQGISSRSTTVGLEAGMLLSNEPGIYKEGHYGIRTENVILVVENQKTSAGTFLSFETLTHCPIDTRAIDVAMLTEIERDWLNNYHSRTYETLAPHLNDEEKTWLKTKTATF